MGSGTLLSRFTMVHRGPLPHEPQQQECFQAVKPGKEDLRDCIKKHAGPPLSDGQMLV